MIPAPINFLNVVLIEGIEPIFLQYTLCLYGRVQCPGILINIPVVYMDICISSDAHECFARFDLVHCLILHPIWVQLPNPSRSISHPHLSVSTGLIPGKTFHVKY